MDVFKGKVLFLGLLCKGDEWGWFCRGHGTSCVFADWICSSERACSSALSHFHWNSKIVPAPGTVCLKKGGGVKCWLLLSVIIRVIRSVYTMHSTLRIFSNFIFSPKCKVGYQINCQKLAVWIEAIQKLLHGSERLLLERSTRVNCVSVVALWGQINKYSVLLAWSFYFL